MDYPVSLVFEQPELLEEIFKALNLDEISNFCSTNAKNKAKCTRYFKSLGAKIMNPKV